MQQILNQMLEKYEVESLKDKKNAIKEIVQEMVLCGLSRAGFFNHAAFYGGTALGIFYGLDRFSEDLDFSLLSPNDNFELSKYSSAIENEINSWGLDFKIEEKIKSKDSNIKSAFLKGNTQEHILTFYQNLGDNKLINPAEVIKIKFEIDTNPPVGAGYETKFGLLPSPYQVKLYDAPSLFAGKIHACLCRDWKTRIKGRDFYDYIFFLSRGTKVNLAHLKARLLQSNYIEKDFDLNIQSLKSLLNERFAALDWEEAKNDVTNFIKDKSKLDIWSTEFFAAITEKLQAE